MSRIEFQILVTKESLNLIATERLSRPNSVFFLHIQKTGSCSLLQP
jgi:hypothetical protein